MDVSGLLLLLGSYVEQFSIHKTLELVRPGSASGTRGVSSFIESLSHLGNSQTGDVVRLLEISCLDVPIDRLG